MNRVVKETVQTSITGRLNKFFPTTTHSLFSEVRLRPFTARGFTLLELLVVITLISLVTAITIPSIRTTLFSDQLKASARRLVGFINEVSQEAISSQVEHQVNFGLNKNEIWVGTGAAEDEEDQVGQKRFKVPEQVKITEVVSVSSGNNAEGTVKLYFSKKGYVDKSAIHLRSDDGREMTIVLSPFMGATRIIDSYVSLDDDLARF